MTPDGIGDDVALHPDACTAPGGQPTRCDDGGATNCRNEDPPNGSHMAERNGDHP